MTKLPLLVLALFTASCGSSASQTSTPRRVYKAVNGYRDVLLGSSFEDAIGVLDADLFNPVSLHDCFHDLALKGCGLSPKEDDTIWELREGIPYALSLSYNRNDKLTDLTLRYSREGGITAEQCRGVFARTVDWVAKDYGPLTWTYEGIIDKLVNKRQRAIFKTPAGNQIAYSGSLKGSFVSDFMHLAEEPHIIKVVKGERRYAATKRNLSLLQTYIVVGNKPSCDVTVEFEEPDNIERADYIKLSD